jgi:hypothetical protein
MVSYGLYCIGFVIFVLSLKARPRKAQRPLQCCRADARVPIRSAGAEEEVSVPVWPVRVDAHDPAHHPAAEHVLHPQHHGGTHLVCAALRARHLQRHHGASTAVRKHAANRLSDALCARQQAYIFGFFFGRTPLIKLSPKKTWEGAHAAEADSSVRTP